MRLMDIVNSIVTLPSLGMSRNAPTPVVEKVEEEEVVVNEDKLKHTITKKEWSKIPKYNKHIGMDGIHYIMKYDDKIGTYLQGVKIEG
jgi:hypothetical protein